jgi:Flp pilus assembly protein TadB
MNAQTETALTAGDVVTEAAGWVVSLGIVTMALFPFALPGLVLAAVAVVPLLLLALLVALVAVVVAAPLLAVRGLRRRTKRRREGASERHGAAARAALGAAPSATVTRS